MKSRSVSVLTLLSLVVAGVLCLGFLGDWNVAIAARTDVRRQLTDVVIGGGQGRVNLYFHVTQAPKMYVNRRLLIATRWRWRLPELRRSVWEFDAHKLPFPGASVSWIVAFPIWVGLLPTLGCPAMWWLRRRRRECRGFAVESVTASAE